MLRKPSEQKALRIPAFEFFSAHQTESGVKLKHLFILFHDSFCVRLTPSACDESSDISSLFAKRQHKPQRVKCYKRPNICSRSLRRESFSSRPFFFWQILINKFSVCAKIVGNVPKLLSNHRSLSRVFWRFADWNHIHLWVLAKQSSLLRDDHLVPEWFIAANHNKCVHINFGREKADCGALRLILRF